MKNKKMIIGVVLVVTILASLAAVTFAAEIPEVEAWKAERLQEIRERLDIAVTDGRMTAEEADEFYDVREERIADCDGTGAGLGTGGGMGRGRGGMGGTGSCVAVSP